MAKLILSLDGVHLSDYLLDKERTSIGRRSTNDIHLDNLAISGDHAAVVKVGNNFYVEDQESTNGTLVNNELAKKQLLQHEDVIAIGKYKLQFLDEETSSNVAAENDTAFEKTMLVHPAAVQSNKSKLNKKSVASDAIGLKHSAVAEQFDNPPAHSVTAGKIGRIQVLNGSNSGRELVLNKALTTLGKTGVQVAVITKRPNGYFITHVEGQVLPIVNGVSAGTQAFALNDHDVVELAGVKMEFYLANA